MKVVLILPPSPEHFEIFNRRLSKFYFQKANIMPPLGLGYIASVLLEDKHDVTIIDMNASNGTEEQLVEKLKVLQPDIIGISVLTHVIQIANKLSKIIKVNCPEAQIIYGGRHVELYPEYVLTTKEIDYAIIGEGEESIKQLIAVINRYKNQKSSDFFHDLTEIDGLIFRNDRNEVIINQKKKFIKNLDTIPFPSIHLFEMELYSTFFTKKSLKAASMITSRGCPFQCNYCAEKFSNYRFRSVDNVIQEIKWLYNEYNVREIYFNDGTFTTSKKWTLEFCNKLIENKLNIEFNIRTRVDCVDGEILAALSKAGCNRINYGFESGNETILKNLGKNITVQQIQKAVKLTKENNIPVWGFFMFGAPEENRETINDTIKLSLELDLDYAQFSRLNPFPGTEIYKNYLKEGNKDIWLDFVLGKAEEKNINVLKNTFNIKELDKLVVKAYKKFYYRPRYIIKKLKEIRSFSQLLNFIKAAITIF